MLKIKNCRIIFFCFSEEQLQSQAKKAHHYHSLYKEWKSIRRFSRAQISTFIISVIYRTTDARPHRHLSPTPGAFPRVGATILYSSGKCENSATSEGPLAAYAGITKVRNTMTRWTKKNDKRATAAALPNVNTESLARDAHARDVHGQPRGDAIIICHGRAVSVNFVCSTVLRLDFFFTCGITWFFGGVGNILETVAKSCRTSCSKLCCLILFGCNRCGSWSDCSQLYGIWEKVL